MLANLAGVLYHSSVASCLGIGWPPSVGDLILEHATPVHAIHLLSECQYLHLGKSKSFFCQQPNEISQRGRGETGGRNILQWQHLMAH